MSETKKKEKRPIHTTPVGVAKYPKLTKPDTKFNKDGLYGIKVILPADEAQPLVEMIDKAVAEKFKQAKEAIKGKKDKKGKPLTVTEADPPYEVVTDSDGKETGEVCFNFKMKAKITDKDGKVVNLRPALFDAKGKPITKPISVWGGSKVKVAFELIPFHNEAAKNAGVSLRLKAVKIIELVSGGSRSASDYGFGDEDEGYVYDESEFADTSEGNQEAESEDSGSPDAETDF